MKEYKLWNDGSVLHVNLDEEPRIGDVISISGKEYTVIGRRFVGGVLHWSVTTEPKSFWDDPSNRLA